MTDLKVGLKLKPTMSSMFRLTFSEAELIQRTEHNGSTYWWAKATALSGIVTLETFSAQALALWEPVPTFFQVGKKYISVNATTHYAKYKVLDVYEVDNPESEADRITAVAKITQSDGREYISTLGVSDFARMKEVS